MFKKNYSLSPLPRPNNYFDYKKIVYLFPPPPTLKKSIVDPRSRARCLIDDSDEGGKYILLNHGRG